MKKEMKKETTEALRKMIRIPKGSLSRDEQKAIVVGVIWIAKVFSKGWDDCYQAVWDWFQEQGFPVDSDLNSEFVKNVVDSVFHHGVAEDQTSDAGKDDYSCEIHLAAGMRLKAKDEEEAQIHAALILGSELIENPERYSQGIMVERISSACAFN